MENLLTYFVIVAVGIKMGGKGDPFISLSKVMKNLTGMYNFDEIYNGLNNQKIIKREWVQKSNELK